MGRARLALNPFKPGLIYLVWGEQGMTYPRQAEADPHLPSRFHRLQLCRTKRSRGPRTSSHSLALENQLTNTGKNQRLCQLCKCIRTPAPIHLGGGVGARRELALVWHSSSVSLGGQRGLPELGPTLLSSSTSKLNICADSKGVSFSQEP